jgi:hypothetical protein
MTPQQLKAMKLALEALELLTGAWQTFDALDYGDNAITAIKEALAEHAMSEVQRLGQEIEQAPVAHWSDCAVHSEPAYPKGECDCSGIVSVADYTALSDKYVALSDKYVALKEQHKEQEPVAWMSEHDVGFKKSEFGATPTVPLYTTPPQRKPLTDEQIVAKALHLSGLGTRPDVLQFARAIEAAHGIKGNA